MFQTTNQMMFGRIVPGEVQLFQSLAGFATSLTDPTAFFHLPELVMFRCETRRPGMVS
jgi:hypothetical protein